MKNSELEKLILQHVRRPRYRPSKPRLIAKELKLPQDLHADLKRAIKRLVKRGVLKYGSNHLVQVAEVPARNLITGVFQRAAAGFGFVRPKQAKFPKDRENDIFIPAPRTKDAATGDLVQVRLRRRQSDNGGTRVAGEIVDIVQRGTNQFVGTYFEEDNAGYVRIDGNRFSEPIFVGDPGAKNAQPQDKVVIEMVRFPSLASEGEAVISEVLGKRGEPGLDTLLIMREYDLPQEFPEDVLEDSRRQAQAFDENIGDDRMDLTDLTVLTIDPADARDFDDAISLERNDAGHWRLGVHIADVSHFVRKKSPLDREARDRATSIYLPDRVIPMLPEVISNNLASLQPGKVRYTKTAFIEFTEEGVHVSTELVSAAIKSDHRFNYEEVDEFLEDRESWLSKLAPPVFRLLEDMHQLAMTLRHRRLDSGSLEMDIPEIKLKLDAVGKVSGARRVVHTESHQIIEEFMLAANEAVAVKLRGLELHFLRRVHEAPDPRKLKALTQFVRELGLVTKSLESRFEIKRVLAQVRGKPEQHAVNYAVLRSMQKAVYGPQDEGHYALASQCYSHFTSPIRRYPDLTIHRMVDALCRQERPVADLGALVSLGEHCSDREQRAEGAERELTKLKLLDYLSKRVGQHMSVVVTGVENFGLFVQGLELPADGLIHVNSLTDDYYRYDEVAHCLVGNREQNRFQLGDVLLAEIANVDLDLRELDFRFIQRERSANSSHSRPKQTSHPKNKGKSPDRIRGKSKGSKRR